MEHVGGGGHARTGPSEGVSAPLRRYWGDLHGQSGETIGMGSAEDYFRYARDAAFVDIVGHQGNDFQITDVFWQELNQLTAEFDVPRRFVPEIATGASSSYVPTGPSTRKSTAMDARYKRARCRPRPR